MPKPGWIFVIVSATLVPEKSGGIFGIPDPEYLKIAMKKGRGEFLLGLFVS